MHRSTDVRERHRGPAGRPGSFAPDCRCPVCRLGLSVVTDRLAPGLERRRTRCARSRPSWSTPAVRGWVRSPATYGGLGSGVPGDGCSSTRPGSVDRSTSCTPTLAAGRRSAVSRHGRRWPSGRRRLASDQLESRRISWAAAGGRERRSTPRSTRWPGASRRWTPPRSCSPFYHEPEGQHKCPRFAPGCPEPRHSRAPQGPSADYVNMWHNVRARFDALGVDNVAWVMNYTGYVPTGTA